jgi:hypothetical protein
VGVVKDTYDILLDLRDRLTGQSRRNQLILSKHLEAIASLLDAAGTKLKNREVPRREAKELATLINLAEELAAASKREHSDIAYIFNEQLPKIGRLMRDADFFIDERSRYRLHDSYDKKDPKFPLLAKKAIYLACEEMERAAGTISAYRRKYENEGNK